MLITEEHLNHWISEFKWQLGGLSNETHPGKNHYSPEYIREKTMTLLGIVRCIEDDMRTDGKKKCLG